MKNNTTQMHNTPYQLKLPLEIEKIIEISDQVYTFCEVLNQIDLKRLDSEILQNNSNTYNIRLSKCLEEKDEIMKLITENMDDEFYSDVNG